MREVRANNSIYKLIKVATILDGHGLFEAADHIDQIICVADLTTYVSPQQVAETMRRVIIHLIHRSKIQNRDKFIASLRKSMIKLNPVMLSMKKNNPSSAIGAAINILRSILVGQTPTVISQVLTQLERML